MQKQLTKENTEALFLYLASMHDVFALKRMLKRSFLLKWIAGILIDKDFSIDAQDECGNNALQLAIRFTAINVFEYYNYRDFEKKLAVFNNDKYLLQKALEQFCIKTIRLLLKFGINQNAQDIIGETALHTAVRLANIDILKELHSVRSSIKNHRGQTAYDLAVELKRKEVIEFFENKT